MISRPQPIRARPKAQLLPLSCGPQAVLDEMTRRRLPSPVLLDSSAADASFGRCSIAACLPLEVLTLQDGALTDAAGNLLARQDNDAIWSALNREFTAVQPEPHELPAGLYLPGWIGFLGYELGRHVERLPG